MLPSMYHWMVIIGPLILLAALIWFTVRNWRTRRETDELSERSARELRGEIEEERLRRSAEGTR